MTTIINNPDGSKEGSGTGMVVGVLVAILIVILVLIFGLPYLRNGGAPAQEPGGASVDVNVPLGNGGEGTE